MIWKWNKNMLCKNCLLLFNCFVKNVFCWFFLRFLLLKIYNDWNKVVLDVEKIVGYLILYMSFWCLISDEFFNVVMYFRKLVGMCYLFLKIVRYIFCLVDRYLLFVYYLLKIKYMVNFCFINKNMWKMVNFIN